MWRRLFPEKPEAQSPVRLEPLDPNAKGKKAKQIRSTFESLENRIAPAYLLPGGKVLKYMDTDGDVVTITFSKSLFANGTEASKAFTFSTGDANDTSDSWMTNKQQLQLIDLSKVDLLTLGKNPAAGVSFTVSVAKGDGGDGLANIGGINSNVALGSVKIQGDLGYIVAGSSSSAVGLKSLDVVSLGLQTDTQLVASGSTATYTSTITGALGSFHAGIVDGAYLHVTTATGSKIAIGKIGSISIDHYLTARALETPSDPGATAPTNDGLIQSDSDIGTIKIGSGNLTASPYDGLTGGWGTNSGSIISGGKIGSITINGNILGGDGTTSGLISSTGNMGTVKITGSLTGGAGGQSGSITSGGNLSTFSITGDIVGGAGATSGVVSSTGTFGTLKIIGSLKGGDGSGSGSITAGGNLNSVTVGTTADGGIHGGTGDNSGLISSNLNIGTVKIIGDIQGGDPKDAANPVSGSTGLYSGGVSAGGKLGSITVTGSLEGGGGYGSGFIEGQTTLGTVKITGDIVGGAGAKSANITSGGNLSSVVVMGSLEGGSGDNSGAIVGVVSGIGNLASVKIGTGSAGGDIVGGTGRNSGSIVSGNTIGSINVTGVSSSGSRTAIQGGGAAYSGSIYADGAISSIVLGGDLIGGDTGVYSASITAHGFLGSVTLGNAVGTEANSASIYSLDTASGTPGNIGKIVGGVFSMGENQTGENAAQISADGSIASIKLADLQSSALTGSTSIISGAGLYSDGNVSKLQFSMLEGTVEIAGHLGSLSVTSSATGAIVRVGEDIGSLTLHGPVSNSYFLAAGPATHGKNTDLAIGSITINGDVSGSVFEAGYDQTGQAVNGSAQIGAVKVIGNWTASDLVAGVQAGTDGYFGTADDTPIANTISGIVSKIASVTITGKVSGSTDTPSEKFGFVAETIGRFQVGKTVVKTPAGSTSVDLTSDGSVTLMEV